MKLHTLTHYLDFGACLATLVLGVVGCNSLLARDTLSALQIVQVQILTEGECTVPGEPTDVTRSSGTFDVFLPMDSHPPYWLPLIVTNNLEAAGGAGAAAEMNNIVLTHFTVELSADGMTWDESCPSKFDSEKITHILGPGGGSYGNAVTVLTSRHAQCLLAKLNPQPDDTLPRYITVNTTIRAKGSHGGTTIESAPFDYPIDVCTGCLQVGYNDAVLAPYQYPANIPMCAALTGSNPYMGNTCLPPGQDEQIFCCGVATTVNGTTKNIATCPGTFTGGTNTSTSTSTSTSP